MVPRQKGRLLNCCPNAASTITPLQIMLRICLVKQQTPLKQHLSKVLRDNPVCISPSLWYKALTKAQSDRALPTPKYSRKNRTRDDALKEESKEQNERQRKWLVYRHVFPGLSFPLLSTIVRGNYCPGFGLICILKLAFYIILNLHNLRVALYILFFLNRPITAVIFDIRKSDEGNDNIHTDNRG